MTHLSLIFFYEDSLEGYFPPLTFFNEILPDT